MMAEQTISNEHKDLNGSIPFIDVSWSGPNYECDHYQYKSTITMGVHSHQISYTLHKFYCCLIPCFLWNIINPTFNLCAESIELHWCSSLDNRDENHSLKTIAYKTTHQLPDPVYCIVQGIAHCFFLQSWQVSPFSSIQVLSVAQIRSYYFAWSLNNISQNFDNLYTAEVTFI